MTVSQNRPSRIVADGISRVRNSGRADVEKTVRTRHACELAMAGYWRRRWIEFNIKREIDRELDKLAPLDALYIVS